MLFGRYNLVVDFPASFYALEKRPWRFSRRFKIIIAQNAICGANVGQQPGNANIGSGLAGASLDVAGCVIALVLLPIEVLVTYVWSERQRQREERYETIHLLGEEFLTQDKGNLCLLCPEIGCIVFKPRWRFWSSKPLHNWNMELHRTNGAVRCFSLTSQDALEEVLALVRTLDVRVETDP